MSDKLTDKLVGGGVKPELSPNPYGSGYTKQVEVDNLLSIANPEVNVLYICQGRKYKYAHAIIDPATNKVLVPAGFVRVENGPQNYNVDGGRGTPVHENVAPQVPPRVFNEPVALNGGVTIKGKKIEDYIDSEGGVTEEELANALALYAKKVDSAQKYVVTNIDTIPSATIALLKAGDVILVETPGLVGAPNIYESWIVTQKQEQVSCEISYATGNSVESIYYIYSDGNWVRNSDDDLVYGVADLKVNGNSVVDENGEVNLITHTAYDADTNPIATIADASGHIYMHKVYLSYHNSPYTKVKFTVYTPNKNAFDLSTLKTFLNTCGFTAFNLADCFLNGLPVALADTNGSGTNTNHLTTNHKIVLRSDDIIVVYFENALTTDGSTITNTVSMRWNTTGLSFESDTVIEL